MRTAYILLGADNQELKQLAGELFGKEEIAYYGKYEGETEPETGVWVLAGDPRERLETMPQELKEGGWELGRIIGLIDLAQIELHKNLEAWAELLYYFCDVVLVKNTTKVAPHYLSALKKKLKDRPMLFVRWPEDKKEALVASITYPEARRLSQYFEDLPEDELPEGVELIIDEEGDDEDQIFPSNHNKKKKKTNVNQTDLDVVEDKVEEKYFARDAANRWVIKIVAP